MADAPCRLLGGLFRSLERLNDEWDLLLDTLKEEPKDVAPRDREFKNILSYFIFRHLKGEEIKKELFFCLLSYYIIEELYKRSDGSEGALLDIARQYSAEIEYSSYNLATLRDLF